MTKERTVVWLDGALVDPTSASLHWSDHGITVGDGAFETIELRAGTPFALSRHLDRLERSCAGLRFTPPTRPALDSAIAEVSAAWGAEPGRLRVTVTTGAGPAGSERGGGGPTLLVTASPMSIRSEPTRVCTVPFTRNENGALVGLKTTSYAENVVALDMAREQGATEAIFADTSGNLCEGTGTNVFVAIDGRLITPPLSTGCLAGVTRALLLEALDAAGTPAVEEETPFARFGDVDEAFLVSTARHVQPISHVDGVAMRSCPGPLTSHAASVWRDAYPTPPDPPRTRVT